MSDYDDGSGYRPDLGPARDNGPQRPPAAQEPDSVAAMIMGIFAILLSLFCGILAIPVGGGAIVFGIRGRRKAQAAGKGAGLAVAGISLGIVSIVVTVVFLAFFAIRRT